MLYGINTETLEFLICISWYYRIIDEMKYLKFAKNGNNLLNINKREGDYGLPWHIKNQAVWSGSE